MFFFIRNPFVNFFIGLKHSVCKETTRTIERKKNMNQTGKHLIFFVKKRTKHEEKK